ncbi:phosphoglycerate mutase (2,3-diphosphoglycerate-independent) [Candidatus Roizmanbacteria bacterium RIFCSPLOWO2_02_FULL_38_10]|uniref:2,3-bisphosphoglycerate-independent phosphoglycerate mutase n=1 Tax=Candidatus Roizmanbacteria bacterium RIFCSPLOWO2_02_FULL_38_10 TaxID=1802074 RepID=A0A1F7JJI8_9BACT|nr:MAG: phosphoglycerate mutase (2,3-diphosphoglycerate-independent) [Candidatus Roizmanbacteria bacterium RIFCSPLOWO2_02_FULL_38_10]
MNSVVLVILDGFGIAPAGPGNAISLANAETINSLLHLYPNTRLSASGEAVGLPKNEVGSTEVGHLNIGAGRIVYQSLPRINQSVADGSFYKNEAFNGAISHVSQTGGNIHLIGLIGSGTVHASIEHLYALLYFFKEKKFNRVNINVITDGRDSSPRSAKIYLENLESKIKEMGIGKIVSIMGRYYAMDRDRRWSRVEKAYRCLTEGVGRKAVSWREAIDLSYAEEKTDEFIEPTNLVDDSGSSLGLIKKGDAVIFFNYRIDRPRELTKAFVLPSFESDANLVSYDPYATKYEGTHIIQKTVFDQPFTRGKKIEDLYFVTMTEYERNLPTIVAFPPHIIHMPLGRVLSQRQMPQLRMAESEKERFVTFYFNGLRETNFPYEDRIIIPSPKVATYDLMPEMSAVELTSSLIKKIYEDKYRFILVNYANPDMVAHTGSLTAAKSAIKTIDSQLKLLIDTILKTNYTLFITADHGNIEEMIDAKTGQASTEHSGNPVPFYVINNRFKGNSSVLQSGMLADIAPTILSFLHVPIPSDMTGRNLLEEIHSY